MESNLNNTRFGKCRFCFCNGNHRDIMKEYHFNGIREVYFDLFQECFNLYLCTNSRSSLICLPCIQKLREAFSFRMMVVSAEQQLLDALDEKQTYFVNLGEPHIDVDVKEEKQGEVKSELNDSDGNVDDDDYLAKYDEIMTDAHSTADEDLVDGEAEFLARFPPGTLPPLPTRATLEFRCKQFVKELELLKGKKITPNSIKNLVKDSAQHRIRNVYMTEKLAHITNLSTILEHSNLTAFKTRRRSGFPCFYCRRIYENFEILRDHQYNDRCKSNMKKILNKSIMERLVVYVHITEIKCTICDQTLPNLNELKSHLTKVHKKKLHPEYGDRIIPFKLTKGNEYECQTCGFNFETFGAIERHMNVHYRNFVCDQCGAGYVTQSRLKVHLKYSHIKGVFPCDICNKVYNTQYKHKCHVDAVHKMVKKNKCPKCPERFTDYFDRHQHMVEAHGEQPLRYRCNVCDTVFKRRYALSLHMKRRHLEVKDKECSLCSYKCHTIAELKAHMIKHNGERTYECMVCKKSYARKKTLKEHMRIHNNDRRYVCVVCGQAFVQNCSLKGHMKAHHSDYVNGLPRS
ncbi:zinc finger protein draculin-like isoform X1 [Nymphalis io]|uniref:zinc finger protein draculin-like isoform X1 n=2 Tax=Inachis io TaxID=171585 RepID=UPI0021697B6F|nr:zinc finger protein draculin-like isoform X1 [Nymphalis io]